MPRVTTVKKAQKDQGTCSKCGSAIKVGDSYRWWKFKRGGRYVRCSQPSCSPKASDLTQSEFYSTLYDIQDRLTEAIDDFRNGNSEAGDLSSAMSDLAEEMRTLGQECQDKYDNMPEGFQQGDTGQLLQTRAEECDSKADELESAASEVDGFIDDEDLSDDEREAAREEAAGNAEVELSID